MENKVKRLSEKAPGVCLVVDMVVRDFSYNYIMLIKKKEGHWGLPGGFVEVGDYSIGDAATRELFEETGVLVSAYNWTVRTVYTVKDPRLQKDEKMFSVLCERTLSLSEMKKAQDAMRPGADEGRIVAVEWAHKVCIAEGKYPMFQPHLDILCTCGFLEGVYK